MLTRMPPIASLRTARGWCVMADSRPGEFAGKVIEMEDLAALLARFGMIVKLDESPGAEAELQAAQMAHALVGAAEAHATRAEHAYRAAGADSADIGVEEQRNSRWRREGSCFSLWR
jgi:hypothetical protein